MIYRQLKEECRALGFENTLPSDAVFLSAANRALSLIACERGKTKTVRFPVERLRKMLVSPRFSHTGGTCEVFSLCGRAFSLRASGSGHVTVNEGGNARTLCFSGKACSVRGLLSGEDATLTFGGGTNYAVSDLTVFFDAVFDTEDDVLLAGDERVFPMSELTNDFLCFSSAACDDKGNPIPEATLSSGEVRLPEDYSGRVAVTYRTLPKRITGNGDGEEIDLSPECEVLLPLLTSAYLWLDDDPDKATYYMSLYREALASVKRNESGTIAPRYHDVIGW